jgi:hypothetical protein
MLRVKQSSEDSYNKLVKVENETYSLINKWISELICQVDAPEDIHLAVISAAMDHLGNVLQKDLDDGPSTLIRDMSTVEKCVDFTIDAMRDSYPMDIRSTAVPGHKLDESEVAVKSVLVEPQAPSEKFATKEQLIRLISIIRDLEVADNDSDSNALLSCDDRDRLDNLYTEILP